MADKQFFVELGLVTKELIQELNKSKQQLKQFGTEVKSTFETAGGSWKQLTDGTVLFKAKGSDAFITVSRHVKTFKESLSGIGSFLQKYSTQFIAIGGIITGALTATIYQAAEAGDRLDDLSKSTGITATELSRLGYAAEQNGASLEQMANGLKVLYAKMGDARSGLKEAQDAFNQLGVSWQNLDGSLKSGSEIIPEIAEKIAQMTNETEQSALASELFGRRAGHDLLPMLQLGSKGIQDMAEEADRLGITMDSVQAKTLGDFNDALTALKGSMTGLLRTAIIPLVEYLKPFVERLTETAGAIRKWSEEHKTLSGWLMKLVGGGGLLLIALGTIGKLIGLIGTLKESFGGVQFSFSKLISSLTSAPALITAAIGAGVIAFGYMYDKIQNVIDKNKQLTEDLGKLKDAPIEEVTKKFKQVEDAIKSTVDYLNKFSGNIQNLIINSKSWFTWSVDAQKTKEMVESLGQLIGAQAIAWEEVADRVYKATDPAVIQRGGPAVDELIQEYSLLTTTLEGVKKNAEKLEAAIKQVKFTGIPGLSAQDVEVVTNEWLVQLYSFNDQIDELENKRRSKIDELAQYGVDVTKSAVTEATEVIKSSLDEQMSYLKTLLDFGKLTSKQYVQVLEQMMLNEKFTAEEKKNIEQEILSTRLSLYQEAVKGQEQASKQMTDIEEKRKDLTIQGLKDTQKAYDDYRQSIINYANQLRSQFNKTLDIGVINSNKEAETFINSVLQELADKRTDVIEGNIEEIKEIERSGAEERLNIQKELSDNLISLEEETQDKIASIKDRKLSIEKSTRGKMMEQLSKYVAFDKLLAMSFKDLVLTYERYKKDIIAGTPGKVGVDTLQAQLAREKYERTQTLGVSDIAEQLDEYRSLIEEEIRLEEEKQRRIKEIKDKYQTDISTSIEAERKQVQELSQTMLTEIDTTTTAIQEELQGLSQTWLKAQNEIANNLKNQNKALTSEYSQALTDYQKFSSDLASVSKATFETMPNLADIFPPDVAVNIQSMGKETANLSVTFDTYLPRMIQSTSDFSGLVKGHMNQLKESVQNSVSAVNQLAEAINNLKSKEITIKVNFAGSGITGLGMGADKGAVEGLSTADQSRLLRALDLASLQGTL